MENKRTGQVLKIILCLALIVAAIFAKTFIKSPAEKGKSTNTTEQGRTIDNNSSVGVATKIEEAQSVDNTKEDLSEEKTLGDNNSVNIVGDNLKNVDTSLYVEVTDKESALPDGMIEVLFAFTNGEVLYVQDFPVGIYEKMKEEFQKFINVNIKNPETIKEIEIIEDSIKEDKENKKLSFDTKLEDGSILSAEVDLYTFEYQFKIK